MKPIVFFFVAIAILVGCSEDEEPGVGEYTGTWDFTATQCDGVALTVNGFTERIILSKENLVGTQVVADSDCTASVDFEIVPVGNSISFTNENVSCTGGSCTINYSISGNGTTINETLACPGDFQSSGGGGAQSITQNGDEMNVSATASGVTCVVTYQRVAP